MLIGWIKKRVIKSIVDDVIKNLPRYKEQALLIWETHKDEIIKKVETLVEEFLVNKIKQLLGSNDKN